MLFRKRLFTVLALLALVFMCVGLTGVGQVATRLMTEVTQTSNDPVVQDAGVLGVFVGSGINTTIVLCIGLPFFFLFALLAWRNSVGIRTEKRHQETLAAMQRPIE